MDRPGRPDDDDAARFLKEGARSYPDAILALVAFRHEVCKCCRAAIVNRLPEFREAIGDEALDEKAVRDYGNKLLDEGDEILGVEVANKNAGLYFYCALYWGEENGEPWFGT